jgi:hypothetical protein
MSATFDPTLPTQRDHIRLAIGDKHNNGTAGDITNPLLQDEIIDAKLAMFGYPESLAQLCESLIAEYGQRPDEYSESGGVRIKWGARIAAWQKIADNARAGKIKTPGTYKPVTGPTSQATTVQAQTSKTPRSDSTVPTLMEGYRSD